jgi:hypothetical protein
VHIRNRSREAEEMLRRSDGPAVELEDVLDGLIAPIYLRVLFDVGGLDRDFLH